MTTLSKQSRAEGVDSNQAIWLSIAFSFVFTAIIWVVRPLLPQVDFAPDTGYAHYFWKLPETTFWTHATAWIGYLGHQIAIWGTIWYAQRQKLKYGKQLHRINYIALGINVVFILYHLFQTAFWYDGIAQSVSVASSQGSVILMLVLVLLLENQRRGIAFGKKLKFLTNSGRVVREYHGYIFAWAIIYTFWFHPMENTLGHLIGFFYTFLLLAQGSLMYTRAHLNKYWTVLMEVMVLIHGTLVAVVSTTAPGMWPMFFFGFLTMFIVTQMYGLGWSRRWQWGFVAAYIASAIGVYSQLGFGRMNEIARIPVILYGLVFVIAALIWLVMRGIAFLPRFRPPSVASGD